MTEIWFRKVGETEKYWIYNKEIDRNMCGEPIYERIIIPKYIKCGGCSKDIENMSLKYVKVNGKKVADMGGGDGHGVNCIRCGWWSDD